MKLVNVKISKFKSITESTAFEVDPKVTALVGKNESGKTVALQGIYRLNPLPSGNPMTFNTLADYPRSQYARDKRQLDSVDPIALTFELEKSDSDHLSEKFGPDVIQFSSFIVYKSYESNDVLFSDIAVDANAAARLYLDSLGIDCTKYFGDSFEETITLLTDDGNSKEIRDAGATLEARDLTGDVRQELLSCLPKFQYFDDYSTLPGEVSIARLQSKDKLSPGERTALALLKLADVDTKTFTESNYEERKAVLEAAANGITDQLFTYWSQNQDLQIELDIDFRPVQGQTVREPWLQVRVRNVKHRVTLNIDERSKGFIWFFSFLAAFSEYDNSSDERIILLDEPGTSLHAKAQSDLLLYIDEQLAANHQVIYTTHSLFMIDPNRIERCRTVEDTQTGTQISKEIWKARSDTVFPLLGALGVDMSQTLVIGPHQLLVEGPADVVYLQLMSQVCQDQRLEGLDDRWTITPVGGLDKLPTFIALLGSSDLDLTVITDVSSGGNQRLDSLIRQGLLKKNHFIPLTTVTHTKEADIEDLFDPHWYLNLLSKSGITNASTVELHGGRIVEQVQSACGRFDHFKPADYLLRKEPKLLNSLNSESIQRFSSLFNLANGLLPRQ